jgi:hypothetical protein
LPDPQPGSFLLTAQALSGIVEHALFPANGTILMENPHPVELNFNRSFLLERTS